MHPVVAWTPGWSLAFGCSACSVLFTALGLLTVRRRLRMKSVAITELRNVVLSPERRELRRRHRSLSRRDARWLLVEKGHG